jgi:SAM-dependent methyltransferase
MKNAAEGQVTGNAAEVYEEFFVPALFLEWSGRVAEAARLEPGQKVLDVACGTGVLARRAIECVQPGGAVTGLDRNDGMLAVARRKAPGITWQSGRAESLPFGDGVFDRVVSQFGLMFFDDQVKALREMWRVLRRGGRLTVAVWASLARFPGYAVLTALLERLFGPEVAGALKAPFILGEPGAFSSLFASADIPDVTIATLEGKVRFPSLGSWIRTEIKGWTLADVLDDVQYEALQRESQKALAAYVRPDGSVEFVAHAHIANAEKR